jgi:hypothetical protein
MSFVFDSPVRSVLVILFISITISQLINFQDKISAEPFLMAIVPVCSPHNFLPIRPMVLLGTIVYISGDRVATVVPVSSVPVATLVHVSCICPICSPIFAIISSGKALGFK